MKTSIPLLLAALMIGVSTGLVRAQAPGSAPPPPGGPERALPRPPGMPVIAVLDANGDGTVDRQELARASEALQKLDVNHDGQLSLEEMRPAPGPGGRGLDRPGFGGPGREGGARPPREPDRSSGGDGLSFASVPQAKSDTERKLLDVLADVDKTQRRGSMSVPEQDGRILRLLAESLGAKQVVEIGTSIGYSSLWFCLALQKTDGKLTTFEIDAGRAAAARSNFKRAGVEPWVTLIEGDAHEEVAKVTGPIDLLFLDADKEGYLDYLNKLLPKVRPGGLIVAHNMNQRQADPRYVRAVTTNPDLETVFLNMETSGIGVTLKKR